MLSLKRSEECANQFLQIGFPLPRNDVFLGHKGNSLSVLYWAGFLLVKTPKRYVVIEVIELYIQFGITNLRNNEPYVQFEIMTLMLDSE